MIFLPLTRKVKFGYLKVCDRKFGHLATPAVALSTRAARAPVLVEQTCFQSQSQFRIGPLSEDIDG